MILFLFSLLISFSILSYFYFIESRKLNSLIEDRNLIIIDLKNLSEKFKKDLKS